MTERLSLTTIWLVGLIACLVLVELYFRRAGFLFPDMSRTPFLQPIATLYGVYIAGILGAWYVRRFKPPPRDPEARVLFVMALVCTLVWNVAVVYLVGQRHVWPHQGGTLEADLATALLFGKWFSFLVWPVNVYYFGTKPQGV